MIKEIRLPSLGEGIQEVEISEVMVKPGDQLDIDDIVLVLESDKATMEIPATESGQVSEVFIKIGDRISEDHVLLKLEAKDSGESVKIEDTGKGEISQPSAKAVAEDSIPPISENEISPGEAKPAVQVQTSSANISKKPLASPSVRKFARELGCEIARVRGSGIKGRITKEDVQNYIKTILFSSGSGTPVVQQPLPDFSQWGEVESIPLNKIRRLTGEFLSRSWNVIPHVTQYDKSDITAVNSLIGQLKKTSENPEGKLTLLPFIIKAVVQGLQTYHDFNSSLDPGRNELIRKKYYNIGIAVETANGLVVPVIKNADQKNLKTLNRELFDLSNRARSKKVKPDELKGATFTITSLGGIGGTYFSPIVNLPEVAILGISRYRVEPVYQGSEFVPRTMLPFSLSYDHRVIDGAAAARFTRLIAELLEDISKLHGLDLI